MEAQIVNPAKQLGESIRALRLGRSLSQEELAQAAGVSSTLVSRVERGGDVKISNVLALAAALEVTLDELTHMQWDTCPRCQGSGVIHLPFIPQQNKDALIGISGGPAGGSSSIDQQDNTSVVYNLIEQPAAKSKLGELSIDLPSGGVAKVNLDDWVPDERRNFPTGNGLSD